MVAAATVGGAEAEKGETERMREKVGDTALGGTGVQTVQTTEMVVEAVEETTVDPEIAGEMVVEATAVAGEAAVDLVEAADGEAAVDLEKEAAEAVSMAWKQMWWWVKKEWADYEKECEQNMLIDFRWEAVGQRSTGWWWQKHSWNEWRQVVTAGKAVAAKAEETSVDEAAVAEAVEAAEAMEAAAEAAKAAAKAVEATATEEAVVDAAVGAGEVDP